MKTRRPNQVVRLQIKADTMDARQANNAQSLNPMPAVSMDSPKANRIPRIGTRRLLVRRLATAVQATGRLTTQCAQSTQSDWYSNSAARKTSYQRVGPSVRRPVDWCRCALTPVYLTGNPPLVPCPYAAYINSCCPWIVIKLCHAFKQCWCGGECIDTAKMKGLSLGLFLGVFPFLRKYTLSRRRRQRRRPTMRAMQIPINR